MARHEPCKTSAAILLAAGASSRTAEPKQLHMVDGVPLVRHQVERLLENGMGKVYVILGYHAREVERAVGKSPYVEVVFNPAYKEGMFSSVLCGIAAAKEEALFIHPVDIPVPVREVFELLLQSAKPIAIPLYRGRKGHPLRIDAALAQELLQGTHQRLDHWLHSRQDQSTLVEVQDGRVVMNANTSEALEQSFAKG